MNKFSCYIIGETGLLVSCAERILECGHTILGIISGDNKTQEWARKHNISISASDEIIQKDFDYLFSIANTNIIPLHIIKRARKYAINYHDSLLPKYAGTNAPTWSILNGESKHGVSWHIVEVMVDSGDILEQAHCDIDQDETTLSLNLKCFQLALSSFDKLLRTIETNNTRRIIQDLHSRTFYFKHQKPQYGGVINWYDTAENINRLCRALFFGDRLNEFAIPRVFIDSNAYIVKSQQIGVSRDTRVQPGEILFVFDNAIEVSTSKGSILLSELVDHSGANLTLTQIIQKHDLIRGKRLRLFSQAELLSYQLDLESTAKNINNVSSIAVTDRDKIKQWNITDNSYFVSKPIHQLFEEAAEYFSERVAVTFKDVHITYDELNKRSNKLARYLASLKSHKPQQETIGILMDRSVEMVISMLATLKSGMAYLPIDTFYPVARIEHMLTDAKATFVITMRHYANQLSDEVKPIFIDEIEFHAQDSNPAHYDIHSLIYILYTSGSTGKPKGVDLMHLGVANLLTWYRKNFDINSDDNILIFTAFGFDLTQKNILGGLISGANVKLLDQKLFDVEQIVSYIYKEFVSFINCPPSAFYAISDEGNANTLSSLRIILLGGETIKTPQIRSFIDKNPSCLIVNTYGPTECSDLALTHNLTTEEIIELRNIPLGTNVGNVSLFILDERLELVPVGATGEIYIGGVGLARGYWQKPEHTAQTFIANPFTDIKDFPNALGSGSRLYKTGDLGRYLPTGQVEFLGRIDSQVKLRGFRIELGEIETIISGVSGIKQNVVVVHEYSSEKKGIVAYVVLLQKLDHVIDEIRERCAKLLPYYMQPDQIVAIDQIPLTPNGKIDRKALPKPQSHNNINGDERPQNEREKALAEILSELLNATHVSRVDNFFRLGGDSIVAIKLVALMKKRGYYLTISDLYNFQTIKDIASNIVEAQEVGISVYLPFSLIAEHKLPQIFSYINDIYPASLLQKGMLVESLKDSRTYHDVFSYVIRSSFNFSAFLESWEFLINKHQVFKTSFLEDAEETYLVFEYHKIDLKKKIIISSESDVNKIIDAEASSAFDLSEPGLFRLIVVIQEDKSFSLIISFHHALLDGWSLASLMKEFVDIYNGDIIDSMSHSHNTYAEFVRAEIQSKNNKDYLNFWKRSLEGFENKSHILTFGDARKEPYSLRYSLDNIDSMELINYCKNKGIPADTVFLSAFFYALSRVGNYVDIMLSLVVNNRPETLNAEKQVGLYLNAIPFRYNLDFRSDIEIDALVQGVNESKTRFLSNKNYPYIKLKQDLGLDLYDFCFNYVHFHILSQHIESRKIEIGAFHEKTNIPCTLDVWRNLDQFTISLNVNVNKFLEQDIQQILKYTKYFLESLISKKRFVEKIVPTELESINQWNTQKVWPKTVLTLERLIEKQAHTKSDSIAVVTNGVHLTYGALNTQANQYGRYIRNILGMKSEQKAVVCLDRSENALIAIFALLKAGIVYVPIDPNYPDERIEYILRDTAAKLIITDRLHYPRLTQLADGSTVLVLGDANIEDMVCRLSSTNLELEFSNSYLAYIMYTSGSTGRPKGVMVEHGSVVNYIRNVGAIGMNAKDNVDFSSNIAFDLTITTTICALAVGSKVVVYDGALEDVEKYGQYLDKNAISIVKLVPSYFESISNIIVGSNIKKIILGGEKPKLSHGSLNDSIELVVDEYGPTEATIGVCSTELYNRNSTNTATHIRYSNIKLYILDESLNHVPIGTIGELYIGGDCLARGYLALPALTAERFTANPFAVGRMYKTGDLARFSHNGSIEYIGRSDLQVKIRGYRIELGEIEVVLSKYRGIKQCVVIAKKERKSQHLVGYYVSDEEIDEVKLRGYLVNRLPQYMIPSVLIKIDKVPLNSNGKLDRALLPKSSAIAETYVIPKNEQERQISRVWEELLDLESGGLSVHDDFFKIGGDSIISIQLISRLRQRMGLSVSVKDIFQFRTVQKLSDELLRRRSESAVCIPAIKEESTPDGDFDLLSIQQWFFKNNFKNIHYYNQSFLILTSALNLRCLEEAINNLISRHDAFRIRFKHVENDRWVGFYENQYTRQKLELLDIRSLELKEESVEFNSHVDAVLTKWQDDFNIQQGPLWRIGYIYGYKDGTARIYFAMHHLIVDAVSWRIICQDLQDFYDGNDLGSKSNSYKTWGNAVQEYEVKYPVERLYWEKILKCDRLLELELNSYNHSAEFELNPTLTNQLIQEGNKAYHTQINDLLVTAIGLTLRKITGNNINCITLEGHGREMLTSSNMDTVDVSHTIGWFTTMYPVRIEVCQEIGESIKKVKEGLRKIPNRGIGYGAFMGYNNDFLPGIVFNYLGRFDNIKGKTNAWHITNFAAGKSIDAMNLSPFCLCIDAITIDGKVKFFLNGRIKGIKDFAALLVTTLAELIEHCSKQLPEYTFSDFADVQSEVDLVNLPLIKNIASHYNWFEMTEIQKAYLLGRSSNYEIGNVSNHIYKEYYYNYIDAQKLESAINILVSKCEALRVVYSYETLKQRFLRSAEVERYTVHINDFSSHDLDQNIVHSIRDRLSHTVYDPNGFPLFTFEVTHFKSQSILHFSMDLILLDAQSRQLLFELLDNLYKDISAEIVIPNITFKDYQDYCQLLKGTNWYQRDRAYWQKKVIGMPTRPEFPFKVSPLEIASPIFMDHTLYIDEEVWLKFKSQADKYRVSYSSALLGLFGSIISYFSGYKEFLITVTLFNRYAVHKNVERILGDFTSTTLFHYLDFGDHLIETIQRTHDVMWEDINHSLFSGLEVQREFANLHGLDNKKAISPIVFTGGIGNKISNFENTPFLDNVEIMDKRYWSGQTSQSWIDVQAVEVGGRFMSKWLYVSQLFDDNYISDLNKLYCELIRFLAEHDWEQKTSLFRLPIEQQDLILRANSDTSSLTDDTLFSRYEREMRKNSWQDNTAVIDDQAQYSYAQLTQGAERLSSYLFSQNIDSKLIAIWSEKGYNQIVSAIAIMKTGAGYLPMSYDWPTERVRNVLLDSGTSTVLISRKLYADAKIVHTLGENFNLIVIEDALQNQSITTVHLPVVSKHDIAYVIYTSGSTGKPKGVTITHEAALNTIDAVNNKFQVTQEDKVLALSDLSFDLSVYDIFGLISVGGTIVFPSQDMTKTPKHWVNLINNNKITIWNSVPQLANLLVSEGLSISSLRLLLISGDRIPLNLPVKINQLLPSGKVISLGGATEASIWSIWYAIDHVPEHWKSIPYGIAMPNQKIYVLNSNYQHCPVDVVGEIYIGGVGVAKDYWNNQDLSNKAFIHHNELGIIYRTGDLGSWHYDGYVEYIGRRDAQTKIRGYRVELEEIESQLSLYPDLRQVIVTTRDIRQEQSLVAYYIADHELDESAVKSYLASKLPDYMVPQFFIKITEIPVTNNGKVDKDALPIPVHSAALHIAPRNDLESKIHDIWSDVLNLSKEQISVTEDFFKLGGNSISVIKLVSRVNRELASNINIIAIYNNSTIARLAQHLSDHEAQVVIQEEGEI